MDKMQAPIFQSRINTVSVIAGIMLTLASMFFFMSLAAALGFWTYRPDELPTLGRGFWIVAAVGWTVSVFAGSFLTVVASRSKEIKDGILNAITTWAGSYLLFGGIALTIADTNLRTLLGSPMIGIFWHGFISDAIALGAGIVGGVLGTYFEQENRRINIKKIHQERLKYASSQVGETNSIKGREYNI